MLYYEDGIWGLTTFGVGKVEPPQNFARMCALADEILPAHVAAAIRQGEPIGDVAFHKYPTSRWRRYDKLDRFPGRDPPVRRRRGQLQPDLRPGHDDDVLQAGHLRGDAQTSGADLERDFNQARPRRRPTRYGR